ncbi:MAG: hypothetical protein ACC642_07215 [Pseudomonadales bacterium]
MRSGPMVGLLLLAASAWVFAAVEDSVEAGGGGDAKDEPLEFSAEVEKLLSETSDSDEYIESTRCISTRLIRSTLILDDRHVVFEMSQRKYQLVQFKTRCPRLRRDSTLVYEVRGSQLCRLDQIRPANSFGHGQDIGPPCSIPGFTEVTREQVSLLRETLKNQRRQRRNKEAPVSRKPSKSGTEPG